MLLLNRQTSVCNLKLSAASCFFLFFSVVSVHRRILQIMLPFFLFVRTVKGAVVRIVFIELEPQQVHFEHHIMANQLIQTVYGNK